MSDALTTDTLDALRRAATLVTHLPIGLVLRSSEGPVLQVTRPDELDDIVARTLVSPCGFRVAVSNAWKAHRAGRALGLRGFTREDQPQIDIVLPEGAWTDNVAVHHVPRHGTVLHVVATTAPPATCEALAGQLGLCAHHDPSTDVTLLAIATPLDDEVGLDADAERVAEAAIRILPEESADTMSRWGAASGA